MKHTYKIFLNDKLPEYQDSKHYSFQRTSGILLELSPGHACVTIPTSIEKTQEDFLEFNTFIFRDAFRKAMQVHIILYGRDLFMNSVTFEIDGEGRTYKKKNPPGFPFVFSMLGGKEIKLVPKEAWEALIGEILKTPKSLQDQDLRFSAAFAYWAGLSRGYELDRFNNFWVAMNAYYSYFANLYHDRLKKDSKVPEQLAEWNKEARLKKKYKKDITVEDLFYESENAKINFLAHWLTGMEAYFTSDERKGRNYAIERLLRELGTDDDLEELYEAAWSGDSEKLERFAEFKAQADSLNTDLFSLLLLFLPYHYRNAFFHGNKSLCLFMTFNDYEYTVLHAVNVFLDRFLRTAIPGMFSKKALEDEAYESLKRFAFDGTLKQR